MGVIPVAVRERIIHLYDPGKTTSRIAEAFGYCKAAVRGVRQQGRERSTLVPRPHLRGRKSGLTDEKEKAIREAFTCFVKEVLVPKLSAGDVAVMDNLSSHKAEGVAELIEGAGAKLSCLPPYSPDLKSIVTREVSG